MRSKKRRSEAYSDTTSRNWKFTVISLLVICTILLAGSTVYLSKLGMEPWTFYANLANPNIKFVHIPAGLRKEQTAEIFSKYLGWKDADKEAFIAEASVRNKNDPEGVFFPTNYWISKNASGKDVADIMIDTFYKKVDENILKKNKNNFKSKVNVDTAIKIASILQREAAGPEDMKVISGVIWNRLFQGMKLEMDATLQYSKGTSTNWWPKVSSGDKKIASEFNTYKYKGLPPAAISNPGIDALYAAYNPTPTDCIFYIHDNNRGFHCSVTYEEHKDNIAAFLGRK